MTEGKADQEEAPDRLEKPSDQELVEGEQAPGATTTDNHSDAERLTK